MQNPFFRRQYTHPSSHPFNAAARCDRGVPVQRPPKVVSIPVHFVDSEISRSTAAKRIQKVFRGFLVRKNVNKIAGILKQVVEMEANLSLPENVDLVRKDDKERLKVNETLMSLLLNLDSVLSFDSGVRDFRKSVIKKVIVLQERLDAIIMNQEMEEVGDTTADDNIDEIKYTIEDIKYSIESNDNQIGGEGEMGEVKEESVEKETKKEEATKETVVGDGGMGMEQQQKPDLIQGKCDGDGDGDERKEVMERMMEKNEILIGMVKELCEKNKMQTEIINSLCRRVDGLEKAFKRSKSKKRKQKTHGSDFNHVKKL